MVARTCRYCGEVKPIHHFKPIRGKWYSHTCTDCHTKRGYRRFMELTPEQREQRAIRQQGYARRHREKLKAQRHEAAADRLALAQFILAAGRRRGMSNVEISRRSGVSTHTLTRIGKGVVPKARTEKRLVKFYDKLREEESRYE